MPQASTQVANFIFNVWKHRVPQHEWIRAEKHFRRYYFKGPRAALIVVETLKYIHTTGRLKSRLIAVVERLRKECSVSTNI